jgi:hypothetical protein
MTTLRGNRFSHTYLEKGEPTADNARMRRRISGLIYNIPDLDPSFGSHVGRELGVDVPYEAYGHDWHKFVASCQTRDLLDLVTVGYSYLERKKSTGIKNFKAPQTWIIEVARIFKEENVYYKVDDIGGVHFAIDEEFEHARTASIAVLQQSRYNNVRTEFERTYLHLSETPPNGKAAMRSVFAATEGLFRLIFNSSPRLTSKEIDKHLAPIIQQQTSGDRAAAGAAVKLLAGFKDWVDAAHFYRHEAGNEEPSQPSLGMTVCFVSLGSSFVRWLAEIDSEVDTRQH